MELGENEILLEDILEEIVGADTALTKSFIFHKHVYRLPRLRSYTEVREGETVVTNKTTFIQNLKLSVLNNEISTPSLKYGILHLEI